MICVLSVEVAGSSSISARHSMAPPHTSLYCLLSTPKAGWDRPGGSIISPGRCGVPTLSFPLFPLPETSLSASRHSSLSVIRECKQSVEIEKVDSSASCTEQGSPVELVKVRESDETYIKDQETKPQAKMSCKSKKGK